MKFPDLFPIGTWATSSPDQRVTTAKPLPRVSDAGQEASKQQRAIGMIEWMSPLSISGMMIEVY